MLSVMLLNLALVVTLTVVSLVTVKTGVNVSIGYNRIVTVGGGAEGCVVMIIYVCVVLWFCR